MRGKRIRQSRFVYSKKKLIDTLAFSLGEFVFNGKSLRITTIEKDEQPLGLYGDTAKIPPTAVIRTKKDGDVFTKFGGGSKKLADYFTDKKIPLRLRDEIPLLADGKNVLVIFGVAVSDKIKVDNTTEKIIKFTYGDNNEKA